MKYIERRPKLFLDRGVFNDIKDFTVLKIAAPVSFSAVEGLFVLKTCSDVKFLTPSNIFHRSSIDCTNFFMKS